jgi:4a-hydroxytetrahydrobiopterin dehydratase
MRCALRRGWHVLSDEKIGERLARLNGSERVGDGIRKQLGPGDLKGSVDLVNRPMPEAEAMNHHPALEISWRTVTVSITTHSAGGPTENDFEPARRIDQLA